MALISKASSLVLLFALGCSDEPELNELGLPYDRWLDRPVQVRLRSERPQRKCQARPHNQWIYSPKANRNSLIFGFLGCKFGNKIDGWLPERYVRLDKPYFGFVWIRHDAYPGCKEIARCDARMTFVSEKKSTVPFRRIKALRDELKEKYGVGFMEEFESESDYHAIALVDGEYRIELFVRAKFGTIICKRPIVYELGFEVVNECCVPSNPRRTVEEPVANWHGVLHATRIAAADAENEAAWVYDVGKGPTTEEMLDDWVRNRDPRVLAVGLRKVGECAAAGTNSVVVCPEWDADDYSAQFGTFVKHADYLTAIRLGDMLHHPELFEERKRTKTGDFQVGRIYCELIPGDRVLWYENDWHKSGTVCAEGEEGEWWNCIRRKMKSVTTVLHPACGSIPPTDLERDCIRKINAIKRRKQEVRSLIRAQLGREADFTTNGIASVTNFLNECLSAQRPGLYVGTHAYCSQIHGVTTKDAAQLIMDKRGRDRLNDYQYDQDRFRTDVLRLLKHERITDELARGFSLSRYELVKLRDWDRCENFENIVGRDWMFPETLVLRHRLFYEKPIGISDDEVSGIIEGVSSYSARKLSDEEAERAVLKLYEVLIRTIESSEDVYGRVLPVCTAVMSQNSDRLVMRMLFARLGVEFKGETRAKTFLKQVCDEVEKRESGFFVPNWKKELLLMQEFVWSK